MSLTLRDNGEFYGDEDDDDFDGYDSYEPWDSGICEGCGEYKSECACAEIEEEEK